MPLSLLYFIVLCSAKCVHPTLRLMCLKYSSFCEQNSRLQTLFRMLIPPVSFVAMLPMYLHLVAPWLRSLLLHCSSQLLPGQPPPTQWSPAIGGCQVSWARLPVSVWAGREQSVVLFEFCGNQAKCHSNINRRVYLLLQSEKD